MGSALTDTVTPVRVPIRTVHPSGAEAWTDAAVAHLVALQDQSGGSCREGAWTVGDRWAYAGGALYATALNALTLADALGWD